MGRQTRPQYMVKHTTNRRPVAADEAVAYRLVGAPEVRLDRAGNLAWGPGAGPEGQGRIECYAVVPRVMPSPVL